VRGVKAWVNWLNTTQAGQQPNTYYWRGRRSFSNQLNPLTLASGLDDYPRAVLPSLEERHADLQAWMVLAHRVLSRVAKHAGAQTEAVKLATASDVLRHAMMGESRRSIGLCGLLTAESRSGLGPVFRGVC
jgi:mannosyl-oligosaccharide glucosidase